MGWEKRLNEVLVILNNWMKLKHITETTPEECIHVLMEKGYYLNARENAQLFRKDLRKFKSENKLPQPMHGILIGQNDNRWWFLKLVV